MKIFVFELMSAGGMGPHPPPSLLGEGLAMLAALVEDFDRLPGVETLTLLDRSCGRTMGRVCRRIGPGEERNAFQDMVALADAVLVIAPEFAELLADRSRLVLEGGKCLVGSAPAAIELSGDKLALARHFIAKGILTPPAHLMGQSNPWSHFPAVCKPRYGAGSQATYLVQSGAELSTRLAEARGELPGADFLLQPFVAGQPASVSLLMGPHQVLALQPATQRLSVDGRFHYLGGELPLQPELARRAVELAQRAVRTVAGLAGPVGVDLVLGAARDGSQDWAIEINPRLTTSYIGLRRLAEDNLAGALLRIVRGEPVSPMSWRAGPVTFSAAGE